MTWRGSTTAKDRFFACLPYLLPIIAVFPLGQFLFAQFPALGLIYLPLTPLLQIYFGVQFVGLIIFFVLFMAVVQNLSINHFIRFNTMQAILIDILLFLCQMLLGILRRGLGDNIVIQTLYNVVFLGVLAMAFYSIVQSVIGRYAEIPTLSEAVYTQVR